MAAEAVLSAVLKELLNKLSSLVQNEIGLLWGLEDDKKKLVNNLSAIRAVLHDAEMRQVNQMAVKNWLGKLKDAAYDAEDLVDEFIFEARRRKVVNQQGMRKKGWVMARAVVIMAVRCCAAAMTTSERVLLQCCAAMCGGL